MPLLLCKVNRIDYICEMNPQEVILVGAGGHALSIAEFAQNEITGYISNEANIDMPGCWFGDDSVAPDLVAQGKLFHMAYVYSGLPSMGKRRKLLEDYGAIGAQFATLIAPSALITPKTEIGKGSAIMAGTIINRSYIGRNVIVNSGVIVEHDCMIGENTFIGPGAVIGGFTTIGENCFIGLGARIGNGLSIGNNISISMGAIVNRNLTEPGIYHGSPLKHFKM